MNEEPLSRILNRCLDRIAAGESVAACIARYPQHADELAPLLAAAGEVAALQAYHLSDIGRQRMRAEILRAEVIRNEQRAARWWRQPRFGLVMPRLALALLVVLVGITFSTVSVAASQPGDLAYGVRIAVERVPALLAREPGGRARAELGLSERRLGDLDRTRSSQGEVLDERVLDALLYSAEQASALALDLPAEERAEISARLLAQAKHLARLGSAVGSDESRAALQAAAERLHRTAERTQLHPPQLEQPVLLPTPGLPPGPVATRKATPTAPRYETATVEPGPTATVIHAARPTQTAGPLHAGPGASATPKRFGSTSTPGGPDTEATPERFGSTPTPQGPRPSTTPQGPGPNPTAQGPVASGTQQGPGLDATPQGPGPAVTSQGPGPGPVPPGPGASATAEDPGPRETPPGPGPSETPEGPGPHPTAQGADPSATSPSPGKDATPQGPGPSATPRRQG